jgi:hypothetical protein
MGKPGVFKRIDSQDKTITPFKVYKSWRYDNTSSLDNDNIDRLVAIKPNPATYSGNKVTLDTWQRQLDSSSLLVNLANNKEASMIWYSLNHLYYKRAGRPYETFGYADPQAIERTIFNEASVISIPQKKFGETIKPGSVKLRFKNTQLNTITMSLYDDGKGNLIDSALSASVAGEIVYLGFNSSTYSKIYSDSAYNSGSLSTELNTRNEVINIYVDTLIPEYIVSSKNVTITPNPLLSIGATKWGNAATFAGAGYIRLPNREDVNFKQSQDYAVSFWANMATTGSGTVSLLTKRTTGTGTVLAIQGPKTATYTTGDVNYNISQYPFDITYNINSQQIFAKQSTGGDTISLSSYLTPTSSAHILINKTGSRFELYVNGTLADAGNTPSLGNIYNEADIFIGSLGIDKDGNAVNGMYGDIDEFFIFNKGLTQREITQLSYTGSENLMTTNTNAVGNVFYEHGMIVLSDPRPKYGTAQYRLFNDRVYNYISAVTQSAYIDDFYLEYNSTVTLYEHEYICKLKEDEFNFTSNPTIRLDNNPESDVPKAITSNSEFAPYITAIGLYTSFGELVAIGKLGTPIKKRDNVDLNLIVRFDI